MCGAIVASHIQIWRGTCDPRCLDTLNNVLEVHAAIRWQSLGLVHVEVAQNFNVVLIPCLAPASQASIRYLIQFQSCCLPNYGE